MSNEVIEGKVAPGSCRTTVRFSPSEYFRLCKEQLLTGRSIPWLLKTRYFGSDELRPPPFDYETSRELIRQISGMANNLNQIARQLNSGLEAPLLADIGRMLQVLEDLRTLAMRDYGDS